MPTFLERIQELENMEPELTINNIELIERYLDCLNGLLTLLKENPIFMTLFQEPNLYDLLLKRYNDNQEILNQYHSNQIKNKRF